jgi:hypothetical protein
MLAVAKIVRGLRGGDPSILHKKNIIIDDAGKGHR